LIALLPQKEKIDSEGYTVEPGGFHAIFLPYADDIRDSEQKDNGPEPDPELLRRAHKLIELGTTPSYETLSNPSLQHHYAVLQALALNLPDVEKVEDTVEPDQRFVEQFENVHEEFARLVYGEDADLDDPEGLKSSSGQKRKTTAQSSKDKASSSKPPSKRGGATASKRGGRGGKK
jgi:ATP-dependent DNA helicase 2 subunit 1